MEQIYLQDFPYFLFILRKFEEDFPFKSQQFEEKTADVGLSNILDSELKRR